MWGTGQHLSHTFAHKLAESQLVIWYARTNGVWDQRRLLAECVNLHKHQWQQMTRCSGELVNNYYSISWLQKTWNTLFIGIDEEPLTTMEQLKEWKRVIYEGNERSTESFFGEPKMLVFLQSISVDLLGNARTFGSKACVEQINPTQPPPRSILTGGDVSRCLLSVI